MELPKTDKVNPSDKIPISAWTTLAILSSIATMAMYAETMLVPAIPDLIKDFSVSYSSSSWILTAFLISGAVMTPISGKLADVYGRKEILLLILVVYAIGVALGGFVTNFYMMIAVRTLQGVGMSMFPIAFGMIREQFPIHKMAIGQGIITSMFGAGSVIGLIAGGYIIKNFGWHTTFFTIIPVVILLLAVVAKFIKSEKPKLSPKDKQEKSHKPLGIDVKGAILLAMSIISFLASLNLLEEGFSIQLVTLVAVGIVSVAAFVMVERRSKSPIIDFKLLMHKIILPANIMMVIVGLSMFMIFQSIPILVRSPVPLGFGGDSVAVTHVQLPFSIILMIFGPFSGVIISKIGSSKSIIIGCTISTIVFFSLYFIHSVEYLISLDLAMLAVGLSLSAVGITNMIMLATPKQFTSSSLGMTSLIRIVGSSIGPAMAGTIMGIYQVTIKGVGSFPSAYSYDILFLISALLSVVSIVLSISLKKVSITHENPTP